MTDENQTSVTLRIPGGRETIPSPYISPSTIEGVMKVDSLNAVDIESSRAAAEPIKIPDLPTDTVVEVELEGGIRLWTRLDQLREDLGDAASRGAAPDEMVVPPALRLGAPSRGLGTLVIKALNFFDVHPEEFLAIKLCKYWEKRTLTPEPGLYRLEGDLGNVKLTATTDIPTNLPVLVFIHGTASSTEGSFGELWVKSADDSILPSQAPANKKTSVWEELRKLYGEHIYALQHRSLTESPIQNAIDLANSLPTGARLHLVSHSRGGLVGELLSRGNLDTGDEPFDQYAVELLTGSDRATQRTQLVTLNNILLNQHLRVERFVRVACPSRGTSLASGRLDQFFSLLANVAGRTAPPTAGPIVEFFTDIAIAVAKERTDPKVLPGLEAMVPDSPIIRMLNTLPKALNSDLTVIGGDVDASGVLGTIATVVTDVFLYDDDHDLVVDTRYMFGGSARKNLPQFMFDHGGKVNHFSYFKNEKTALQLLRGLRGEFDGFKPYEIGEEQIDPRFYRNRGAGPMPIVFILPGMMGSYLKIIADKGKQTDERIWLDPQNIAAGALVERLHINALNVKAEALVPRYYKRLVEFLAESHEIRPFAYDWRKSLTEAGDRLATELTQALDVAGAYRPQQPVRIIAHSTGGLVARAMIARHPDVWQRMCQHSDSRLVMLGTPNSGSLFVLRLLLGDERLIRELALVDIRHSLKDLQTTIACFPGLLETLPEKVGRFELFDPMSWAEIASVTGEGCTIPPTSVLTAANSVRAQLAATSLDAKRVMYVAGLAPATPWDIKLDPAAGNVSVLATARGDGRVTWSAGIPKGFLPWYIPAEHGDMADFEDGFAGFLELLEKGTTSRLSQVPLGNARAVTENTILSPEVVSSFPDADQLAAAAMGGSSKTRRRKAADAGKIQVGVTHGNLAFISHPVAVGHYVGDAIVSAESYLDRVLDGRLRKRLALNVYPGPLDTVQVFLNPPGRHPGGAIVIGLGQVGELTPGRLSHVFTRAILEYALAREEMTQEADPIALELASVLIGTGAGGFPVEQSVTSILRAVVTANAMLELRKSRTRLTALEFIDLYEDLAIMAARALKIATRDPELASLFQARPLLRALDGGHYRAVHEEPPGWWSRLIVNETETGELKFSAPTDRARTEVSLVATQRAAADQFLSDATAGTRTDKEIGGTLFELLIPNALKEFAPDKRNVVLLLDAQAARFPWEMMFDPLSADRTPLALQAGMLRQFETREFREHPVRAIEPNALVVGDPVTKLSEFPPLSGARAEAQEVAEILGKNEYQVNTLINEDAGTVLHALFSNPYRILHLAGHGVFEYHPNGVGRECPVCKERHDCKDKVSGMVLGPNIFLTPAVMQQMRRVPEFVFINCCHLGNTSGDGEKNRHRLAANLAAQLIRMGVRAIIAAGWEVDDQAALIFARQLYQGLLTGRPFGMAVLEARKATRKHRPNFNTWGAYQAYGDPDFTLVAPSGTVSDGDMPSYISPHEVIVDLKNIVSRAKTEQQTETKNHLATQIGKIAAVIDKLWLGRADVRAAFGDAWFEIGDLKNAIDSYRAALSVPVADVSIKAIEQLANAEVRLGARLIGGALSANNGAEREALTKGIELTAIGKRRLRSLLEIEKTGERLSLYASACKRAVFADIPSPVREQSLKEMQVAYDQAAVFKLENDETDVYYPVAGWMDGTILLGEVGILRQKFDEYMRQARFSAKKEEALNPNFWNRVANVDLDLRQHLADGDLDGRVDEIAKAYRDMLRLHGSTREKDSIRDSVKFLQRMLAAQGQNALVNSLADLGKALRDSQD